MPPQKRVIYLNSSASNKNLAPNQRLAQSKSGVTLDPIPGGGARHIASNKQMMTNPSLESLVRRPVSGISKDGSQNRFRQSQQQFQQSAAAEIHGNEGAHLSVGYQPGGVGNTQPSARHGDSAHGGGPGQNQVLHSVRGLLHDEYSEEAYLIDEVDDEQNITVQDPAHQVSNFCQ